MFDRAPVTKLKQNDERTGRFITLLAVSYEFLGGDSLADTDRPLMDPLKDAARSAADFYHAADYASANRAFLRLSNLVARHPSSTWLISGWKDRWKVARDAAMSDAAIERYREATAADTKRFGKRD